eukprot:3243423-Rhodomonas_salina.1
MEEVTAAVDEVYRRLDCPEKWFEKGPRPCADQNCEQSEAGACEEASKENVATVLEDIGHCYLKDGFLCKAKNYF